MSTNNLKGCEGSNIRLVKYVSNYINIFMYKCEICNKEFEKLMAYSGHKAWHADRNNLDKISAIERGKIIKQQNIEKYLKNPESCNFCNNIIPYEKFLQKNSDRKNKLKKGILEYKFYCSNSCAAKFNNKNRAPRSIESKSKTSESLIKYHDSKITETEKLISCIVKSKNKKNRVRFLKTIDIECGICKTIFCKLEKSKKQYCSKICSNLVLSMKRQNFLKQNGNFSTIRETFSYKDTTIEVDSNLEKAGIVYLKDKLGAKRIERFENILFYNDGDNKRTFNPDFICEINGISHIVEVKQKWIKACNHPYNKNIPAKKTALEKFCISKNYGCLWLDFKSVPELKPIYKNILKDKLPRPDSNE